MVRLLQKFSNFGSVEKNMINTKTDTKKIGLIMLVIMMACSVVSFGSKALAQSDLLPESRQSSGINKVIPGTENKETVLTALKCIEKRHDIIADTLIEIEVPEL